MINASHSSPLSRFFRDATPEERAAVYKEVLTKATARQLETLEKAKALRSEAALSEAKTEKQS